MTHTDLAAVANEAQAWFDSYVETFIGLAAKGSTDPAPLLDYFSVPISMTTGTAHTALTSAEALSRDSHTSCAHCATPTTGAARPSTRWYACSTSGPRKSR
ncbi:hypothetical protein [Streptomyces sp. Ag109_G2-15]|uniref:DUF6841 family protein n=1 Tax=Streptomyces sp. Ag109_G2-15 TaxID=1938850 RepID=UPI000BCBE04E|nr:hypothetical protein [Streptomyces sp. Ag109_G2-15]SOE06473.1 hypothetical protein SAMN06272765_7287 [Streptomyces sp. Ag109_G2-15]